MRSLSLLGITVHSIAVDEFLAFIDTTLATERRATAAYANVHALNLAYTDPRFKSYFNDFADCVWCDGQGVRLGALLLGQSLDHRFTLPDHIHRVMRICVENNTSVYLLGAHAHVIQKAAEVFQAQNPELVIAGIHDGYFDKNPKSAANQAIIEDINQSGAGMLVIGFGMPLQEYWIMDHWDQLDVQFALPVGALFDFMTGEITRAPRFITDNGFEWLARLVMEPRRLWRRYLIGLPIFFSRILRERFSHTQA